MSITVLGAIFALALILGVCTVLYVVISAPEHD
jgi:hypothetical protein